MLLGNSPRRIPSIAFSIMAMRWGPSHQPIWPATTLTSSDFPIVLLYKGYADRDPNGSLGGEGLRQVFTRWPLPFPAPPQPLDQGPKQPSLSAYTFYTVFTKFLSSATFLETSPFASFQLCSEPRDEGLLSPRHENETNKRTNAPFPTAALKNIKTSLCHPLRNTPGRNVGNPQRPSLSTPQSKVNSDFDRRPKVFPQTQAP